MFNVVVVAVQLIRASTHKRVAPAKYPNQIASKEFFDSSINGVVESFAHDPGRGAPLMLVRFENGVSCYTVATEGVFVGQKVGLGGKASVEVGNVLSLGKIPEGTLVCNLELKPGDGGKLCAFFGCLHHGCGSYASGNDDSVAFGSHKVR